MAAVTFIECEVQAAISALGCLDGAQYTREADCFETLKDLIRYLRRDNDRFSVRKLLCESNVITHDLVPLLYTYSEDNSIFDATIRLLINLTQPLGHLFKNSIDIDPASRELFNKLRCSLALNKQAFVNQKIFDCLSSKVEHLLSLDVDNLQEDDKIMLERILTCVRNILYLPKNDEDALRTEFDANVNDHIVECIFRSGFSDSIIHVVNSDDFRYLHLITVEVIALVVKDYKAEELVVNEDEARSSERVKKEEELSNMYSETKMKKTEATKRISRRPTNFAGTYVVSGLKALKDDQNIVLRKAVSSPYDLNFQTGKKLLRTRMFRRPKVALSKEQSHISSFDVRRLLNDFCTKFLTTSTFEKIFKSAFFLFRSNERRAYEKEVNFLRFVRFFVEYSGYRALIRDKNPDIIKNIMVVVTVPYFHYVMNEVTQFLEMMVIEKSNASFWGVRLHASLLCYRALIQILHICEESKDEMLIDAAMTVKNHMFKVMEYSEIFISLLKKFNPGHLTKSFLADLFDCIHTFMKIFETYCEVHGGGVKVNRKRKKRRPRNKKAVKNDNNDENNSPHEDMTLRWESISDNLSLALQGHVDLPENVVPFDVLAEHGFDEKIVSQVRIQEALKKEKCDLAVALLKASKELWPDDIDIFGTVNLDAEKDFLLLRNIFMSDLPKIAGENFEEEIDENENHEDLFDNERQNDNAEENDENHGYEMCETELTFFTYLQRFANTLLLKWYCWLLNDFENNTARTNHTILRLLYRIAYQLKTPPALYQACLFRIFQKLSRSPTRSKNPAFKEMMDFAKHLMRSFYESAEKNPLILMEILFWKHSRLTYELEFGYGTYTNKAKSPWNDELDQKLQDLYDEFQSLEQKPEYVDVLEYIQSKFPCHKSTRALKNRLKNLGIRVERPKKTKKKSRRAKGQLPDFNGLEEKSDKSKTNERSSEDEFKDLGENLTSDEEEGVVANEERSSSSDDNEEDSENSLAEKIPRETSIENFHTDLRDDNDKPRDNFLNNKSTTRIESSSEDELEIAELVTEGVSEGDIKNSSAKDNFDKNESNFFASKKRKLQILSDDEDQ